MTPTERAVRAKAVAASATEFRELMVTRGFPRELAEQPWVTMLAGCIVDRCTLERGKAFTEIAQTIRNRLPEFSPSDGAHLALLSNALEARGREIVDAATAMIAEGSPAT